MRNEENSLSRDKYGEWEKQVTGMGIQKVKLTGFGDRLDREGQYAVQLSKDSCFLNCVDSCTIYPDRARSKQIVN